MLSRALGLGILALMAALPVRGAIYKCETSDGVVYSDVPCAADAEPITIETHVPSPEERQRARARAERLGTQVTERVAARGTQRRIADLERQITAKKHQMDAELHALRAKRARANNNLAGATWLQSIATEMDAVTAQYQLEIDDLQRQIAELRTP